MKRLFNATATPLASIFGSGFLVIVPILAGTVGPYAVYAMAGVCLLAYAVGGVVRFNIRHAEPLLASGNAPHLTTVFERGSDIALVGAYVISVCLYIKILATFFLGGVDHIWPGSDSDLTEYLLTVAVIAAIGVIGYTRGLAMLQNLEGIALWITLLIIVLLFVGFAAYDIETFSGDGIKLPPVSHDSWWQVVTVLGGTLLVVHGFEPGGRGFESITDWRAFPFCTDQSIH